MGIKKLLKYYVLGETLKEIEMNRILDKISKKSKLDKREQRFLDLYNHKKDEDAKDLMYLSKNSTFSKIKYLIQKGKRVICDLYDRDGKIGLPIVDVINDIESETCRVIMKNEECQLHDRFLYNIIHIKKNDYSLQEQDEYFEKIEASK